MSKSEIIETLSEFSVSYRTGRQLEVTDDLINFLEKIAPDFNQNDILKKNFSTILMAILDCQSREDWLGLADYLEHDLVQLLK